MTHFAGIKCLSKQGCGEEGWEMERNAHHATSPLQTPIMSPQLLVRLSCRDLFQHERSLTKVAVYPDSPFKKKRKKRSIGNHRGNCYNLIYVGGKKKIKDEKWKRGKWRLQNSALSIDHLAPAQASVPQNNCIH